MRNPHESESEREARHSREHAYSMQLLGQQKDKDIAALRKQLEDLRNENPDPRDWQLEEEYTDGAYIALKLRYPKCKNYKGMKVLVFRATLAQLVKQRFLDPHFGSVDSTKAPDQPANMIYPLARFPATTEGWEDAKEYCKRKAGP